MLRFMTLALLAWLLLSTAPARPGPVAGGYRSLAPQMRLKIDPKQTARIRDTFLANERACVMLEGDHKPPMNLTVKIFDHDGKLVAQDTGPDYVAVTWYPPRTEEYTIEVSHDNKEVYNLVDFVLK